MSLYRTGFFIRRSVVLFFIFIGLLISFGIIGSITQKLTKNLTSTIAETASLGFGPISPPAINTISQSSTFKPTTLQVDTVTGLLPDVSLSFKNAVDDKSSLVNVYQIDSLALTAQSKTKGTDLKEALGFTGDPKITQDVVYTWNDGKRTLTYSAEPQVFTLTSTNIKDLDTPSTQPSNLDSISNYFQTILTNTNFDIKQPLSNFQSIYVNYDGTTWQPSANNQPTNFILSYYSRYSRSRGNTELPTSLGSLDGTSDPKIVKEFYSKYYYSPMYMVVKNTNSYKATDIVEMQFNKYDYSVTRPQTYNTKSIIEAINEIQKIDTTSPSLNRAYLVALSAKDGSVIDPKVLSGIKILNIKNVEVGYLLNGTKQSFVLPIYVFTCEFVISTSGTQQLKGNAVYYTYAYSN